MPPPRPPEVRPPGGSPASARPGSAPGAPLGDPTTDPLAALALLGLPATATEQQIEDAFREKALQCHPDKAAHLDEEIRALAEAKFKRLRAARALLLGEA